MDRILMEVLWNNCDGILEMFVASYRLAKDGYEIVVYSINCGFVIIRWKKRCNNAS